MLIVEGIYYLAAWKRVSHSGLSHKMIACGLQKWADINN